MIFKLFTLRRAAAAAALSLAAVCAGQLSTGHPVSFNGSWRFSLDADTVAPAAAGYDDSSWRLLDLPHDWSIEMLPSPSLNACTGFFPGGLGWYRKHFSLDEVAPVMYLCFDGVYNRSQVYVNGHHVGGRPNGYVTFYYDIAPYLVKGDNVVAVKVDHTREADSRWYTGSGIYRDVWLISDGDAHFAPWSFYWKATDISDRRATVDVAFDSEAPAGRRLRVDAVLTAPDGSVAASGNTRVSGTASGNIRLNVKNPRLWDLDSPALYTLTLTMKDGKNVVDSTSCRVGLRTLSFDPDHGFFLNGRNTKVKGVCIHHDAGVLGAVVPAQVLRRKLQALKDLGTNAIRLSHNPQSPVLYDLCDELGLLVMDEASDEWEFPKRKWVTGWNVGTPKFEGSYDFFEDWIETDVADIVRRDRNHPCVAFWSIGNEVDYPNDPYSHPILDHAGGINQPTFGGYDPDAPSAMRIGEIAQRLAPIVRALDTTRPVTGALAGVVMSNQTAYPEAVDIVGYNYTEDRYGVDHTAYPDRVIYGSENIHTYDAWLAVRDNEHIFGQFVWTGTDYLGEANVWPSRGLGTGMLDFGSFMKPRGKFRASLWRDTPVAYLGSYVLTDGAGLSIDAPDVWNYDEGRMVRVVCYTNCPRCRLTLNGRQVGDVKDRDDRTGILAWDIPFAPGEVKVEGLDASGDVAVTDVLRTSGRPLALNATVLRDCSDSSLVQVLVEVVDENGYRIPLADNMVSCDVCGGRLLGLEGTGNTDMSHPRATQRRASNGRVLAYVVPDGDGSPVTLSFTSPLLKGTEITID